MFFFPGAQLSTLNSIECYFEMEKGLCLFICSPLGTLALVQFHLAGYERDWLGLPTSYRTLMGENDDSQVIRYFWGTVPDKAIMIMYVTII